MTACGDDFRAKVMAHKQNRRLALGDHANLYFEDRLTIHYQVQEMLRIERIFEADAIAEELAAYNPLIPDGHNWKATFMLEYDDPRERRAMLAKLVGVEQQVWMRVGDGDLIRPTCDEDLERATEYKTSSVHFMRFELSTADIAAARQGADVFRRNRSPALPVRGIADAGRVAGRPWSLISISPVRMATYAAADIEVLTGLDPVRKRPGMYTDTSRPNHLVQEVVDNSVDEAIIGHARPAGSDPARG